MPGAGPTPWLWERLGDLRGPLAVRDFRLVWVAQLVSELGDWAARLTLSVLVLERSGSPLLAGLVTTASMLPWIGPGQLLATFGDRFPRRRVLITADLARAAVYAAMLLPVAVPVLLLLTLAAGLATPPAKAAKAALLPEILPAERYGDGLAVAKMTSQGALLGGYLAGGGLVATVGARGGLVVNAATFVISALAIAGLRAGRRGRPAESAGAQLLAGARILRADHLLRSAALLIAIASVGAVAAEALVAVYVTEALDGAASRTGLLAAVIPAGTIASAALVRRRGAHEDLLRVAAWIVAAGATVAAVGFAVQPTLPMAVIPYLAVGLIFASIVPANAVVGQRLPDQHRASVFGLLQGSLMAGQALGAAGGGWLAQGAGVGPACALMLLPGLAYAAFTLVRTPPKTRREPTPTVPTGTPPPPPAGDAHDTAGDTAHG